MPSPFARRVVRTTDDDLQALLDPFSDATHFVSPEVGLGGDCSMLTINVGCVMLMNGRFSPPSAQRRNAKAKRRSDSMEFSAIMSVHTMQGGNQEPSSSVTNESLSTLAFLGQQLRQFSSSVPQQRHQNLQSPSLGFSFGQEQSMLLQGNRNVGGMWQSGMGGLDQQYTEQMFTESMSSQSMVEQNVQGIMDHLAMLQERITQLQALVPLISQTAHCQTDSNVVAQQQAASAAVVSIISQLAMTAIGLLPQHSFGTNTAPQSSELPLSQLLQAAVNPTATFFNDPLRAPPRANPKSSGLMNNINNNNLFGVPPAPALRSFSFPEAADLQPQAAGGGQSSGSGGGALPLHAQLANNNKGRSAMGGSHDLGGMNATAGLEDLDNDSHIGDEDSDGENLPPGSFDIVELDATEILAEHTHFCEICGKGFKRDANLRMHMRGHGDEYKTPAALARPDRGNQEATVTRSRRFSCPYVGCKRNKKHRKFQPLKTMLCVKNHYRRSHCPKVLTCQKCMAKKFSVVADLKTHEKHCGRDKWLCSCGTTFSRKDKLFGHIGLFAGHTPVMPHELDNNNSGALPGSTSTNADDQQQQQESSPTGNSFGSESKSSMRFWD